uniref:Uncharacterized protein n=1 Tax=Helicotheca tamesis TaxID=374047 RepID=A0A7S2IFB5_9STRA
MQDPASSFNLDLDNVVGSILETEQTFSIKVNEMMTYALNQLQSSGSTEDEQDEKATRGFNDESRSQNENSMSEKDAKTFADSSKSEDHNEVSILKDFEDALMLAAEELKLQSYSWIQQEETKEPTVEKNEKTTDAHPTVEQKVDEIYV